MRRVKQGYCELWMQDRDRVSRQPLVMTMERRVERLCRRQPTASADVAAACHRRVSDGPPHSGAVGGVGHRKLSGAAQTESADAVTTTQGSTADGTEQQRGTLYSLLLHRVITVHSYPHPSPTTARHRTSAAHSRWVQGTSKATCHDTPSQSCDEPSRCIASTTLSISPLPPPCNPFWPLLYVPDSPVTRTMTSSLPLH